MEIFRRFEFKYPMSKTTARLIHMNLRAYGMKEDPHKKNGSDLSYTVNSLYLDSPSLSDYYDKEGGFLIRKKLRIRIYDPVFTETTHPIMLEKKMKYDMTIHKKRTGISISSYNAIINNETNTLLNKYENDGVALNILHSIIKTNATPILSVRYKRLPLVYPKKPLFRITFDSNMEACKSTDLRYNHHMYKVAPGVVIMEVKFNSWLPYWFGNIVRKFDLKRDTFSKYTNSLLAIRKHNPIPH
jgi:SPX domain protein involved in polyphosphate accumulation